LKTINANSPAVTETDIWISLIVFVALYIALGVTDLLLMLRYSRKGLEPEDPDPDPAAAAVPVLTY
jgi:cytochrome bd ubiquinol oxidase subunit I